MAYEQFDPQDRILRDELAVERTRLANERTLLAYVRTAIMLLATGVTLLTVFENGVLSVATAAGTIGIGCVVLAVGVGRCVRVQKSLRRAASTKGHS